MILGCENVLKKIISYWELEHGKEAAVIFNQVYTNQSTLKEISPGCSLEGLMLKLQYFGHLMQRADTLENTLLLGKIESRRRRG